jgi:hypothetical protein
MRAVAPSAALAGAAPLRLTIRARNLPSARAKSASPALARPPLAGRALVARHPPRRRVVCLVPSAVATGGDDVKVGSSQESSKSAGDDGECAIKSDGQIECLGAETPEGAETTAAPPSRGDGGGDISDAPPRGGGGGGGGGGDDGGGGGDDEGDEGEESSVPSPLSPSAATAALAGWASAAANGAKGASDLAALRSAVDGGIGAAVASLFGLNLVAATALRSATRRERERAARAKAEAEAAESARVDAAAQRWDAEEAEAAVLRASKLAAAEAAARDAGVDAPPVPAGALTALASVEGDRAVNAAHAAEEAAEEAAAEAEEAARAYAAEGFAPEGPGAGGVRFAVIPEDAKDPRVIAALRDAAEAQVAAAEAMRAAAAATRAAADATAAVQALQATIAAGEDEPSGEDGARAAAEAGRAAAAHGRAADRAAGAAVGAAARVTGHHASGGASLEPRMEPARLGSPDEDYYATPRFVPREAPSPHEFSPRDVSPGAKAARAAGRALVGAAGAVFAGVRAGVPVVASKARELAVEHGPGARKGAASFAGAVVSGAKKAWEGVDVETVGRNGRTVVKHRPGLREGIAAGYGKVRKLSGLYAGDEQKARGGASGA